MALVDTHDAIGAVTKLIADQLYTLTGGLSIGVGQPSEVGDLDHLNLYLYHATFDPVMKNTPLDKGQEPPLWLVLKYLITGYDGGKSGTCEALKNLGKALQALREMSFLNLLENTESYVLPALIDNPEELKLTFDELSIDVLSKIMQGPDDKYRFSMGFQVRPVMISFSGLPSYNLLVGIDYTKDKVIGEEGVQVDVLPSFGPRIFKVLPHMFEYNGGITIRGEGFDPGNNSVALGNKPITMDIPGSRKDELICTVDPPGLSAGSYGMQVIHHLPNNRRRAGNMVVCHLLPSVSDARFENNRLRTGGTLLGREYDDIFLALYRGGRVIHLFTEFDEFAGETIQTGQTSLTVPLPPDLQLETGDRVIVRVNGQQARQSPEITIV
jgi:hypothetical protein